ncbi:hypothetical protein KM043_013774 [Ampulex compressa]|nr:hypothetical protein KM043_013774 [Ampulex compressa]
MGRRLPPVTVELERQGIACCAPPGHPRFGGTAAFRPPGPTLFDPPWTAPAPFHPSAVPFHARLGPVQQFLRARTLPLPFLPALPYPLHATPLSILFLYGERYGQGRHAVKPPPRETRSQLQVLGAFDEEQSGFYFLLL